MSDQVNIGEYSLEISGDELVIRDDSGAVIETVELDELAGELILPDGQKIDLASILADGNLDSFQTAAGPANDNAADADAGSGSFGQFRGLHETFAGFDAAGLLQATSFAHGTAPEGGARAIWPAAQSGSGSFDWSRHDSVDPDQSGTSDTFGNRPSSSFHNPPPIEEEGEERTQPEETAPQFGDLPLQTEHVEPRTEIENDDRGNEPATPPSFEQPPANENDSDEATPSTDEQQLAKEDGESEEPSTPQTGQHQQPGDEDESNESSSPPTDEQQPANENLIEESQLQAVNAAPTDIDLAGASVVENASGAIIGVLSVVDPDGGDTHSFSVSDDRFEVVNGQLKLRDGVSLDFETISALDVVVTATDSAGNQFAETFSIAVGDANEPQTGLTLDNGHVSENTAGGGVGAITVADPDTGDIQSFQVSDNRFEIADNQLKLKDGVSLDFESEPSIAITVTAADSGGNVILKDFTINVDNVNEAPVVSTTDGSLDTKSSSSFQPTVDFSDVDSETLSMAAIHTNGFQSGDTLNVPSSSSFDVKVEQSGSDFTITIAGKTGTETVEQFEDFANSISFSTTSTTEGNRHIEYSVTDSGGATSNVSSADITVVASQELWTSQLGKGQTTVGGGDDILHIDTRSYSPVRMGDGYDTVHLAQQNRSFNHHDAIKLEKVEAIDTTGYGANNVSLSIHDVLNMTDDDNRLTIIGEAGDTVTLTGSGKNHWTVLESNADFTTYAYNDATMQAVVEISNQMNAQVS